MDADTIVIGAGAAGLTAARILAERSLQVVLLEARERVGGRVWSRPIAGHVTPAELGAEFIHGRAPETMKLLRDAREACVATSTGESWISERNGELRRDDDDFSAAAALFDQARSLDGDESVEQYLRRFNGHAAIRKKIAAARAFVEGFDAADPAIASVRAIAQEWRAGVDSASARPLGGYGPIFNYLRDACAAAGVKLLSSTTVRRVSWRDSSVTIDAVNDRGESQTIRARIAIVTLPAGVLRQCGTDAQVLFEPALPPRKLEALRSIEMGPVVKVVFWFRTAFWERLRGGRYRNAAFFRCENGPFAVYWTQLPVRSELIVAWAGGPKASALREFSSADLVARARDGFGELFGELALAQREFEGGEMHDWSRDPLACGAYSYVAVGGHNARAALGEPIAERLFFAGEATSTGGQGGTVNGALETGRRAAAQALKALGRT